MVGEMVANEAKLTWTHPKDDGGSPITHYIIESKRPSDYKWSVVNYDTKVTSPEYTVTGLVEKMDVIFQVKAVNKAGEGKPSEPSDTARYGKKCYNIHVFVNLSEILFLCTHYS
jgi:hypothetical protein